MNTPSHFLITAAVRKSLRRRLDIPLGAVLLGSVAPDLPVYLMSLGGVFYYRWLLGWGSRETFQHMFDDLYFHDPYWLAAHNILHSPTLLMLVLAGLSLVTNLREPRSRWLFWFLIACLFHGLIDIITHSNDGPLILFPFDWSTRFHSPVSYWDPKHFGRYFARCEIGLDALLLFYLVAGLCRRWFQSIAKKRQLASTVRNTSTGPSERHWK